MSQFPDSRDAAFRRGGSRSDQPRRKFYEVIRPKGGCTVSAIITSETVCEAATHYQPSEDSPGRGTTYPCITIEEGCLWCKRGLKPRPKGYACGVSFDGGKAVIIEMTDLALETCPALVDPRNNVRGWRVYLRRKGLAPNSPVTAWIERQPMIPSFMQPLASPFHLRSALLNLWGCPPTIDRETGEVSDRWSSWAPVPFNSSIPPTSGDLIPTS